MAEKTLREALPIDRTNLDEELEKQAAMYMFVAEKAVGAEMALDQHRAKKAEKEAELDEKYRLDTVAKGEKVTENAVRMRIERTDEYKNMVNQEIILKARLKLASALRESWYMRKDMLVQLAIKERGDIEALRSDRVAKAA